jgi:hypothetical protein
MKQTKLALSIIIGLAAIFLTVGLTSASDIETPQVMNGLPLLYKADFAKGSDDWQPTDSKAWKIIKDKGVPVYSLFKQSEYKAPVRSPINISLVKKLSVKSFVIEAVIRSTKDYYAHRDMCLFFGYQDASHFYYAHIAHAKNSDPHANSIFLVNGEPRVSIATKRNNGTQWKDGTYHTVRLIRDVETGSIQVFFDNLLTPIITAQDKTFTSGLVGIGSFDDIGNIKMFKVWGEKK